MHLCNFFTCKLVIKLHLDIIFLLYIMYKINYVKKYEYNTLTLLRHSAFLNYCHVFSSHSSAQIEMIWNLQNDFSLMYNTLLICIKRRVGPAN